MLVHSISIDYFLLHSKTKYISKKNSIAYFVKIQLILKIIFRVTNLSMNQCKILKTRLPSTIVCAKAFTARQYFRQIFHKNVITFDLTEIKCWCIDFIYYINILITTKVDSTYICYVAGLERMTTGLVAKQLTLSRHTSRQNEIEKYRIIPF